MVKVGFLHQGEGGNDNYDSNGGKFDYNDDKIRTNIISFE